MIASKSFVFRFADIEVREREFSLIKAGEALPVEPKAFRVLLLLLRNPQKLITKEELLNAVWGDVAVGDNSLARSVALLRRLLGDETRNPRYIETVATVGYRWLYPVEQREDLSSFSGVREPASAAEPAEVPVPAQSMEVTRPHAHRRLVILALCCACVLVAALAWLAVEKWRASPQAPHVQRALTRLTFDEGLQMDPTWSPDGRYIAYSSDRGGKYDIWVQQVGSGNPVQVTKGPGHHWQPDWSPDGRYIAYRSEAGEGGIYVIPALGGAGLERKIAAFGYYPRWSPDGSQVLSKTAGQFFIAQLDGSPARELSVDFLAQKGLAASAAAWYPDGKKITFWVPDSSPTPSFWTIPIAGGSGSKLEIGPAIQKELSDAAGEREGSEQLGSYSFSWSPSGSALYFEQGYRGAKNIWKLTVAPGTVRATGIERLTTGPGPDAGVGISRDGKRLAFSAKSVRLRTWLFPFDAKTGRIKGDGSAITSPGRTSIEPVLSRDGTKVAYFVPHGEKSGVDNLNVRNEVWVKSLLDGNEAPVVADDFTRWYPVWSPDGMRLAYARGKPQGTEGQLMTWSIQNHEEEPLTSLTHAAGALSDWSPDGRWVVTHGGGLVPIASAPHAETGARQIISDPAYEAYQSHFSPDGRWIVFTAFLKSQRFESAVFVVPASGGKWIRITDGRHWDDKPRWSPDGKTIYFLSRPGGFFNVWGIHFDPIERKPVGQPFQLSNFNSPRLMISGWMSGTGFSLAQDKMVLTMAEESGNIWVLDDVDH
jgi:Tol biopolymer transport system component/DNA-binding winged helix-turn-helix (wHTH) protein